MKVLVVVSERRRVSRTRKSAMVERGMREVRRLVIRMHGVMKRAASEY